VDAVEVEAGKGVVLGFQAEFAGFWAGFGTDMGDGELHWEPVYRAGDAGGWVRNGLRSMILPKMEFTRLYRKYIEEILLIFI